MADISRPKKVYCLWDESAHPKLNVSGYDVVRAIRALGSKIGVIKSLCYYIDLSASRLPPLLTSELQCSVSDGREGAASKMLLADLFNHVMDNLNVPNAIMIVSGDPDLSYAVSMLRLRGREVALFCPGKADTNLLHLSEGNHLDGNTFELCPSLASPPKNCSALAEQSPTVVAGFGESAVTAQSTAVTTPIPVSPASVILLAGEGLHRTVSQGKPVDPLLVKPLQTAQCESVVSLKKLGNHVAAEDRGDTVAVGFPAPETPLSSAPKDPSGFPLSEALYSASRSQVGQPGSQNAIIGGKSTLPLGRSNNAGTAERVLAPHGTVTANALASAFMGCVEAVEACPAQKWCVLLKRLPDRQRYPQYYASLERPISLADIRANIAAGSYQDVEAFKADMRLLFENAKAYYRRNSWMYAAAAGEMEQVFKSYSDKVLDQLQLLTPTGQGFPFPSLEAPHGSISPSRDTDTPTMTTTHAHNEALTTGRLVIYGPDPDMHGDTLNKLRHLFSCLPSLAPSMITSVTRSGGDFFAIKLCSSTAARDFVVAINGRTGTDGTFAYRRCLH
ncbi:hypothetical protein BKA70DRAFT_1214696 [Coprinopsis sp. MPI-PUGE-AT-0042]|nr:hypothetical protein BKA70DRAFT_1214696 [Coprinopsis sp. MPI-PUGE-AT-0042]